MSQLKFVDTHVHWHFSDFDADRDDALNRARSAGVTRFVNVGTNLVTSRASLDLALQHPDIYASCGVHPHDAAAMTEDEFRGLEKLAAEKRVVAIGEIGLDFYRDHSPRDVQKNVFESFLDLADRHSKPVIIHTREAYSEMADLLKARGRAPYRGVMHCFSSGLEDMKKFLDLGFYISFAGPLNYKKNDSLREACQHCPLDRLFIETDAPFLPPEPYRGKRNESAYMVHTAERAAAVRGITLEKLSSATFQNANDLFHFPD